MNITQMKYSFNRWRQVQHLRKHSTIKISELFKSFYEIGCPSYRDIGNHRIIVKMESDQNAVYELSDIERAWGIDWNWLTYKFLNYAQGDDISKYPRYS